MGQHVGIEMRAIFLRTHRYSVEWVGKIPQFMQNPPAVILSVVHCVFSTAIVFLLPQQNL